MYDAGVKIVINSDSADEGRYLWRNAAKVLKYNDIPENEVLFNILAPGVVEQHLTFGLSKAFGTHELSFAVMRAFTKHVLGANPLEAPGQQMIDLEMNQWEFEIGWGFGIRR